MLIRSWNVFHGNRVPPGRRGHLAEMVRLATEDAPEVLCLQEVPVWALRHLERWSGMRAHGAVARPARRPRALAGLLSRAFPGTFRSSVGGQANAVLVERSLLSEALGEEQVSDPGRERRVCHAVRVGASVVVAHTHLSNPPDVRGQRDELTRCLRLAEAVARPGDVVVLAGDLNLHAPALDGFTPGGPGIDHVLVRGADATPLVVWPNRRRVQNGHVLSDHAPVELRVSLP